jgi:phosphoglycerol transferase
MEIAAPGLASGESSALGLDAARRRRGLRRSRLRAACRELLIAGFAAVLASAIGAWALQLSHANLRVPFSYESDTLFNLMVIKDILVHGWFLTNPNLGAPLGQELYGFPALSGDSLYLAIIKLLGVFSKDAAVVANGFFLLGFPMIAAVGCLVLRRLGISPASAIVCAALFTVLPARFDNGELHIFLGSYFTIPVSCYLVLALLEGRELFRPGGRGRGLRAYLTWRTAALVCVCLAIGSADNYYALFTIALMGLSAGLAVLAGRRRRVWLGGLAAAAVVLAAIVLNGLPTVVYSIEHGRDTAVARRAPWETIDYGLTLTNLVLPTVDHRIPAFAHLTASYVSTAPPGEGESSFNTLGLVGVVGLLFLAICLLARCADPAWGGAPARSAACAALGAGMAFSIGTLGGLGTLFAYIVNPQLRAVNRIAVFIAFFAFYGAGLALDGLRRRWGGGPLRRSMSAAVLLGVLVLGALDQTSPAMAPRYASLAARYRSDAAFVGAIERQLPPGASVFQLPVTKFPERRAYRLGPDDEVVGYLHSSRLRWSFGALAGSSAFWESSLASLSLPNLLAEIVATGFDGIYLDTLGYQPQAGQQLIAALARELGVRPLVNADRRLYFFDVQPYARELRRRYGAAQLANLAATALRSGGGS